ncbi:MAG: TRAP transporter large permease [Alphaproteobacteria bacterium]|nr:TRAP transporter large permease [Alphaproteobacteria bacterium]
MVSIVAVALLLLFLLIGLPIYLALGFLALLLFWYEGTPLISLPQLVVDHLNSETLIAIPLFVIAATFMQRGGVAGALIDCAQAWVGRARGGLAIVSVVACTIFAAICGSSVATAVAIGSVLIPAMIQNKYENHFALGTVGAAGTLGILIPPSLAMIVYAVVAEESVPRLFLAGVIPGLMQAGMFILFIMFYSRVRDYPIEPAMPRDRFVTVNIRAIPALFIPIIVLGGIYSGIVTVTEAAGLAALVAIVQGTMVYSGVKPNQIIDSLAESIKLTASIVFIIFAALAFGHWITSAGIAELLVNYVRSLQLAQWQFLLFVNVLMLFLGMFLEVFAIILIVLPLILPILKELDISLVHFAIVMTINMEIALISPPIGLNLFVLSSVAKQPVGTAIRGILPYLLLMLVLLGLVTYIPEISLWLPNLVYGKSQ